MAIIGHCSPLRLDLLYLSLFCTIIPMEIGFSSASRSELGVSIKSFVSFQTLLLKGASQLVFLFGVQPTFSEPG